MVLGKWCHMYQVKNLGKQKSRNCFPVCAEVKLSFEAVLLAQISWLPPPPHKKRLTSSIPASVRKFCPSCQHGLFCPGGWLRGTSRTEACLFLLSLSSKTWIWNRTAVHSGTVMLFCVSSDFSNQVNDLGWANQYGLPGTSRCYGRCCGYYKVAWWISRFNI